MKYPMIDMIKATTPAPKSPAALNDANLTSPFKNPKTAAIIATDNAIGSMGMFINSFKLLSASWNSNLIFVTLVAMQLQNIAVSALNMNPKIKAMIGMMIIRKIILKVPKASIVSLVIGTPVAAVRFIAIVVANVKNGAVAAAKNSPKIKANMVYMQANIRENETTGKLFNSLPSIANFIPLILDVNLLYTNAVQNLIDRLMKNEAMGYTIINAIPDANMNPRSAVNGGIRNATISKINKNTIAAMKAIIERTEAPISV